MACITAKSVEEQKKLPMVSIWNEIVRNVVRQGVLHRSSQRAGEEISLHEGLRNICFGLCELLLHY